MILSNSLDIDQNFFSSVKNLCFYRLWKLNALMAKAKINKKSTVNPTITTATTPRKSCLNPK